MRIPDLAQEPGEIAHRPFRSALDHRLRQTAGQWKIIDVVIEGVSLVANFRSQFQDLMARGGAEHLLAVLRQKTAAEEKKDATETKS